MLKPCCAPPGHAIVPTNSSTAGSRRVGLCDSMHVCVYAVGVSLLTTALAHAECKGTCVGAWGNCLQSHFCCGDASCIKKNNYYAGCVPKGGKPGADWDGTDLTCGSGGSPPGSKCQGACLPAYSFCQDNPNCCAGSKCISTVNGNAKCWPDSRRPLFTSWDGTVLTCGEPPRSYCEGPCLPAYEFCHDNPNCCSGTKCIKTVNGNAKCWPDERRPLFTSWDGGVLTCEGGTSACKGPCLPAYEFCQDNPNCCEGSKCIKTVNGNAKCWPDERRPLFTSWDGTELSCEAGRPVPPPPDGSEGHTVVDFDCGRGADLCCVVQDDDYQDMDYITLLTKSADGTKCVLAEDAPEDPKTTRPPQALCGYGFFPACNGDTTVIWMRHFGCQGLRATEDCIEHCRDCIGPGPQGKAKDEAVEAFLDSWVEVPVKEDGCLGAFQETFAMFEKMYNNLTDADLNPNKRPILRHRQVKGPDSFFVGEAPDVCVPCGWQELPVCDVGPPCGLNEYTILLIEDGYCKLPPLE